jgi:G3E family GTPase
LIDTPQRRAAKDQLIERLGALNPAAPILDAAHGEAKADRLLNCGLYDPSRKIADVGRWLADEAYQAAHDRQDNHRHDINRHDDHIRSFPIATDEPIAASALELFIELLRSVHGRNLLRVKGIVKVAETPDTPVVIHGVQHVFHPAAQLAAWPDHDRRTRIVFIVRDIDPRTIRELFGAFLGQIKTDRPDRDALVGNPLVPFGGPDR